MTHSGALAGSADVQFTDMREHGVIVVDDLDELWEVGQLFDRWGPHQRPWPFPRLGIATYSGCDGALAVGAAGAILDGMPMARIVVESFRPNALLAFLGGHRDPEFGPVIVTGLGGGCAEAYGDITHLRCPAPPDLVSRALLRTTFGRMLGDGSSQFTQLQEMLTHVADWFVTHPEVESFDINPVLIGLDGEMVAVDARVETRETSNADGEKTR